MKPDPDFEALIATPRTDLSAHAHEFALMRDRAVLGFYASFEAAASAGERQFGRQGEFTVQAISMICGSKWRASHHNRAVACFPIAGIVLADADRTDPTKPDSD